MADIYSRIRPILDKLDDKRAKEVRQLLQELEKEKENYERLYHIQYDSFKLHNTRYGGNKKGLEPHEYNLMMDNDLVHKAKELAQEQAEELAEKEELKQSKDIVEPVEEKQTEQYVSAEEFQELLDELSANMKKPKNKDKQNDEPKQEDKTNQEEEAKKDRERRRNEFLQQLEDIERENERNNDKEFEFD